jgi:acetyl-CoA carboxylase carboxyl transferase subunit alpha
MLQNAVYSILSPEGYSSILWKDSSRYKEAAEKMKLTAEDLYKLNIIDEIIKEPVQVESDDFIKISEDIRKKIKRDISKMESMTNEELVEDRYQKFRKISGFKEV